jgi:hypothetical protein
MENLARLGGKVFFSEEKKQKTFISRLLTRLAGHGRVGCACAETKVFLVVFFRQEHSWL